eukprot:g1775.t1
MGKKGGKRGGGGMKGFMKQTQHSVDDNDASSESASSTSSDECIASKTSLVVKSMDSSSLETETKSQMRERHKKELNSVKKNAANLGKKKKKEATAMIEEVKQRHIHELEKFTTSEECVLNVESVIEANDELDETTSTVTLQKKSKAQKRREKEAQRELERENRIREEVAEMGVSETDAEKLKLEEKLKLKGMIIHEIRPDGHCLYKAIEHQTSKQWTVESLRRLAAEEMRSSIEEYLPFFVHEGTDVKNAFLEYCQKVELTAEWGGELELQALAKRLHKMFVIYSAEFPDNIIGSEFAVESDKPIQLCFMQHAYHLGAHYNSITKIEH